MFVLHPPSTQSFPVTWQTPEASTTTACLELFRLSRSQISAAQKDQIRIQRSGTRLSPFDLGGKRNGSRTTAISKYIWSPSAKFKTRKDLHFGCLCFGDLSKAEGREGRGCSYVTDIYVICSRLPISSSAIQHPAHVLLNRWQRPKSI